MNSLMSQIERGPSVTIKKMIITQPQNVVLMLQQIVRWVCSLS